MDERTFRRYARELAGRDLAPGPIRTYYANVSAYVGQCVREGHLEVFGDGTLRETESISEFSDAHAAGLRE